MRPHAARQSGVLPSPLFALAGARRSTRTRSDARSDAKCAPATSTCCGYHSAGALIAGCCGCGWSNVTRSACPLLFSPSRSAALAALPESLNSTQQTPAGLSVTFTTGPGAGCVSACRRTLKSPPHACPPRPGGLASHSAARQDKAACGQHARAQKDGTVCGCCAAQALRTVLLEEGSHLCLSNGQLWRNARRAPEPPDAHHLDDPWRVHGGHSLRRRARQTRLPQFRALSCPVGGRILHWPWVYVGSDTRGGERPAVCTNRRAAMPCLSAWPASPAVTADSRRRRAGGAAPWASRPVAAAAAEGEGAARYAARGVSASKEDVHAAIARLDKGLFPGAFCKVCAACCAAVEAPPGGGCGAVLCFAAVAPPANPQAPARASACVCESDPPATDVLFVVAPGGA